MPEELHFFIVGLCTHRAMQMRESQATLEETYESTFLPTLQKRRTWLHSGSGKWSKIRDDSRAKTACQLYLTQKVKWGSS